MTLKYDFIHTVRYYADDIEVMGPAELQTRIVSIVANMNSNHKVKK